MMQGKVNLSLIGWAICGLSIFFLSFLLQSSTTSLHLDTHSSAEQHVLGRDLGGRADLSWRDEISFSPGHQNPAKAPPVPAPEFDNSPVTLDKAVSPRNTHQLLKRGPLRCEDGPCVDGSCCNKDKICGYGPTYCGSGNCTSQCGATAMCGEYSEDGDMPCGMKLCCSAMGWCGTTDSYCHYGDPAHKDLPCQAGYGACTISSGPSCGQGSGGTSGRTIGYYQSWNVRNRKCNKVSPKQLDTTGYTHLFYAFAFIDPASFEVTAAHDDDEEMMKEFTGLSKPGGLQTWIAIGGFDFSDPGPTHETWSKMVSTKANRAAFISSVQKYMDTHGFQGVDIDWEYPGAPERGGNKLADTRNLAQLVREMRAAFGTKYGISLTLAPDYWYLRWFDAKAMESSVDFFGFMAYDLHGSWDADVKALGKLVRGQADIREIANNTTPLWFDGLDPKKINFGLAMYGRGYTLSDPSCNDLLCPFSGPSKAAPCTNFDGVMSLVEIKQLIEQRGLKPKYLEESMMKALVFDDQWIGYDDEETFAAKKAFADGMCFGGTMVWSIDFQVAGSGGPDEDGGGDGDDDDNGGDGNDESDPDATGDFEDSDLPDLTCGGDYSTLEDIENDAEGMPATCAAIYMTQALTKIFGDAMIKYKDLLEDGYTKKFKTYADATVDNAEDAYMEFAYGHGNDYFNCKIAEISFCCSNCPKEDEGGCNFCHDGKGKKCSRHCPANPILPCDDKMRRDLFLDSGMRTNLLDGFPTVEPRASRFHQRRDVPKYDWTIQDEPCPPDFSQHGYAAAPDHDNTPVRSIWWSFKDDGAADKFYADLYTQTAIPKEKVKMKERHVRAGSLCAPSAKDDDDCWNSGVDHDFPYIDGYNKDDVINPKDLVEQATTKADSLVDQLPQIVDLMKSSLLDGDYMELVDSISIPILMIRSAVEQMDQIEDMAEKIDAAKRKAIILAFVAAILFLIPIAGELIGSVAGLAEIGAVVTALGVAGDIAFEVYSLVDDPENAPAAILGIVLAPAGLLDAVQIARAAKFRRGMSIEDVGKMGPAVTKTLDQIDVIKKATSCRR